MWLHCNSSIDLWWPEVATTATRGQHHHHNTITTPFFLVKNSRVISTSPFFLLREVMRPGSSLFRRQYFPSTLCLYICQIFVVWHHFIGAKTTMRFFYAKFHLLQIFSCWTFLGDWDFPLEKETKYKATRASQVPWAFFVELLFFPLRNVPCWITGGLTTIKKRITGGH